jgi:hypothetical protein
MRHIVRRPPTFQRARGRAIPNKNIRPRSISPAHHAAARWLRRPSWCRLRISRRAVHAARLRPAAEGRGLDQQCAGQPLSSSTQVQPSGRSWLRARHTGPRCAASPRSYSVATQSLPWHVRRQPQRAAIAAVRASSIAVRQRGSGRAGSRHLAAGSRLRLRAFLCRSGCNRGAAPVPKR